MAKPSKNPEWFSTYAILTAERILERFQIQLSHQELTGILKNPESAYYHLLTVPLKNIFNGILMHQVHDYQVYAQKLLIDYKLGTPDTAEDDSDSGTHAEGELEVKYVELIEFGAELEEKKQHHQELISESQAWLIKETHDKKNIAEKFKNFHQNIELSNQMAVFGERVENQMLEFQNLRTTFRNLILEITSLLMVLPDYYINPDEMADKREALDFNPELSDFATAEEYQPLPDE